MIAKITQSVLSKSLNQTPLSAFSHSVWTGIKKGPDDPSKLIINFNKTC